mgnify:FL=1
MMLAVGERSLPLPFLFFSLCIAFCCSRHGVPRMAANRVNNPGCFLVDGLFFANSLAYSDRQSSPPGATDHAEDHLLEHLHEVAVRPPC